MEVGDGWERVLAFGSFIGGVDAGLLLSKEHFNLKQTKSSVTYGSRAAERESYKPVLIKRRTRYILPEFN